MEYYPLNEYFELTSEEKALYIDMQEYVKETKGKYVDSFADPYFSDWVIELYKGVSRQQNTTIEDIIAMREKATFPRYDEPC